MMVLTVDQEGEEVLYPTLDKGWPLDVQLRWRAGAARARTGLGFSVGKDRTWLSGARYAVQVSVTDVHGDPVDVDTAVGLTWGQAWGRLDTLERGARLAQSLVLTHALLHAAPVRRPVAWDCL